MGERHPNIVNGDELEWIDTAEAARAKTPADRHRGSKLGARAKRLAQATGGSKLGCSLYEIPPGKRGFQYHCHLGNDEAIYLLEGEATIRLGEREIAVRAGDYISLPAGTAQPHQMMNTSSAPVRYLCLSTMQWPDLVLYPDSQKIGFMAPTGPGGEMVRQLQRIGDTLTYYDGED
jgi:uncharacterized cupin superfamily protein